MALLSLEGVTRRFGGLAAVADLTVAAEPGAVTGLIGPNGAGKTTVVNLVTGLLALSGGRITFEGRDISALPPHEVAAAGIARTFQNIRLLPEQTVSANVLIGCYRHALASPLACLLGLPSAWRGRTAALAQVEALLERFGMAQMADYPAGALSYGHQRRVEIMRALASRPRLLLLDEPVAGMNDVEAAAIAAIMRELAAEGMTLLLIEHNLRFVGATCRVVHVLDAGRLIASGSPAEVTADSAVIEAYLGRAAA